MDRVFSLLTPTVAGGGLSNLLSYLSDQSRENPRVAAFVTVGAMAVEWLGVSPDTLARSLMALSEALAHVAEAVGHQGALPLS